jgi:eukaryotic-like serine/threonine-protein kinase
MYTSDIHLLLSRLVRGAVGRMTLEKESGKRGGEAEDIIPASNGGDHAAVRHRPWQPSPWLILGMAGILGLMAGTAGSWGLEQWRGTRAGVEMHEAQVSGKNLDTSLTLPSPLDFTLTAGDTWISSLDGMVMVYVPGGEFLMGANQGSLDIQLAAYTSRPEAAPTSRNQVHRVYLESYWIDQTEVTNAMYAAFLNSSGEKEGEFESWIGLSTPNVHIHQTDAGWAVARGYANHPVVMVSWYGAQAYCEWSGRRLPSEAEWEKAARGTEGRIYPWGDYDPDRSLLNYDYTVGDTTAVGSYPSSASPYGALDMAGNVWEWVGDWYCADCSVDFSYLNPTGPDSGQTRSLRGGSWSSKTKLVQSAYRNHGKPESQYPNTGFRCAATPQR